MSFLNILQGFRLVEVEAKDFENLAEFTSHISREREGENLTQRIFSYISIQYLFKSVKITFLHKSLKALLPFYKRIIIYQMLLANKEIKIRRLV